MGPVVRLRARTLSGQRRPDAVRQAEEPQGLIDQRRTEVVPQPGAGARALTPAIADEGAVSIEVRLEVRQLAERAARDEIRDGEEVAIPAAILESGEHAAGAPGRRCELARFVERRRERLLEHHVLPGVRSE